MGAKISLVGNALLCMSRKSSYVLSTQRCQEAAIFCDVPHQEIISLIDISAQTQGDISPYITVTYKQVLLEMDVVKCLLALKPKDLVQPRTLERLKLLVWLYQPLATFWPSHPSCWQVNVKLCNPQRSTEILCKRAVIDVRACRGKQ